MYQEIYGDLIELAKQGKFDVIAHGCNCFCTMGAGIAVPMKLAFGCDKFTMERKEELVYSHPEDEEGSMVSTGNWGDINKLGQIDYKTIAYNTNTGRNLIGYSLPKPEFIIEFTVVNAYTQYHWNRDTKPFDYEAFTLCMRKMNHTFKGMHIGLPQIGSHLAGGDWELIKVIIQKELKHCDVTIVIFDKK
jgi:O-acetyl-ADP-ribose deacetylase (regulator of RNase III)